MDLATSGIFAARLWKTRGCSNSVEEIWAEVVAKSMLKWLPDVSVLFAGIWLMMVLQLFQALLHAIPTGPNTTAEDSSGFSTGLDILKGLLGSKAPGPVPKDYVWLDNCCEFQTCSGGETSTFVS